MNQSDQNTPQTRRQRTKQSPNTVEQRRRRSRSYEEELTQTQAQTRKEQKKKQKVEKRKNRRPRRRIFPIWLRVIVVAALCMAGLIGGLMIGYGVLGEGEPKDVLNMETWQHLIDIVLKEK
ncbi:DNA-directed RNA polymerase subunit beta [Ornithinibacillus halophilus]|uniref:DNA-directed RNA polymerase subunit beta n=1 Tax=Ornithinibacillus halophilus TaxID=930117 RepID=A0A1M5N842_9BACI|nr:DNA-directed RNA polymerase subunit beta [Ornithinibacillus halophilus]SHG85183.1 DNA-directed RNA polymerase subunit beta [Ornithinibacillus halophilus]